MVRVRKIQQNFSMGNVYISGSIEPPTTQDENCVPSRLECGKKTKSVPNCTGDNKQASFNNHVDWWPRGQ